MTTASARKLTVGLDLVHAIDFLERKSSQETKRKQDFTETRLTALFIDGHR